MIQPVKIRNYRADAAYRGGTPCFDGLICGRSVVWLAVSRNRRTAMIYVFGHCTLDTSLYALYRAGETVRLRPKVFQVLVYLLEQRDRVVSKDELCEQVWPEQFIGNAPLENIIKLVRQAVGDSGRAQQIIQTLYGHGYRFVAHVERRDSGLSDDQPPPFSDTAIQPGTRDQEQSGAASRGDPLLWSQEEPPPREIPFVGRARELATLYELLGQVENSRGQVVCIEGEPGVGKSRLLSEFRRSLQGQQITYLEARCRAAGRHFLLSSVRQVLRQYCRIDTADSWAVMNERIHQRLDEVGMDSEADAPFLLNLLGIEAKTDRLVALSSDMVHTKTVVSFRRFLMRGSQQCPLILAIEDCHCMDRASEVYLASLATSLAAVPILLLITFRPVYRAAWMETAHAIDMNLAPLTPQNTLRVLHAVLPPEGLPDELADEILAKAAGNPLFLEEVSRLVAERDPPLGDVPASLQEICIARIEQLPDAPKRLLQTASILGQSITVHLLKELWEGPEDLEAALLELQRRRLYLARRDGNEVHFGFSHTLIQDVTYDTIPPTRRQSLHTVAGQKLEVLYASHLDEVSDCLAGHYVRGGQTERAVVSLLGVAEQAIKCFAPAEASKALREALAHADLLPSTPEQERLLLDVHLRLAQSLVYSECYTESLEQLLPQQTHLERLQDTTRTSHWALLLAHTYCALGDWSQVAQHAQYAVEAAMLSDEKETMGQAYHMLAMERYWAEDTLKGIDYSNQAIGVLVQSKKRYRLGLAYFTLALHTFINGDFASALEAAAQVQTIGGAIGDPQLLACAAWTTGWIEATRGDWEAGVAACQRSLYQLPDPLNRAFAMGALGYAYLEKGDTAEAVSLLENAARWMHQMQRHRLHGLYTTLLGKASLIQGDLDKANDLALQGLTLCRETDYRFGIGWAQCVLGQIALTRRTLTPAARHVREALAIFTTIPARFEMGRTHLLLLELAHLRGRYEEASKHVTAALELFATSQAPKYLERTEHRIHELGIR